MHFTRQEGRKLCCLFCYDSQSIRSKKAFDKSLQSCVSFNGIQSSFFPCLRGVRQGENLSPVLFALFLNDLEDFMKARSCPGISLEFVSEDLYFYFKLLVLLYADDTVFSHLCPCKIGCQLM